jgi:electron transport complex protein RnfD
MDRQLIVSVSPHIRDPLDTRKIMLRVVYALAPVTLYALAVFGLSALWVFVSSITGALLGEFLMQRARRQPVTLSDASALVTGLLLALTLPPRLPWWIAGVGGLVAIVLGKQIFGGLGHNIFNPALVGRAVIFVSWTSYLNRSYLKGASLGIANTDLHRRIIDAVNGASPLAAMKVVYDPAGNPFVPHGLYASNYYRPLLFANPWGCIGEVSALLLLLGGIYLVITRTIDWKIPVIYVGTVAVLTSFTGRDPLFYILAGGLLLGAVYMATDYTTSPLSSRGKVIYALGLGLVTFLLRFWSNYPEGVMFSILFMNGIVPIIDRYLLPRRYGKVETSREGAA